MGRIIDLECYISNAEVESRAHCTNPIVDRNFWDSNITEEKELKNWAGDAKVDATCTVP